MTTAQTFGVVILAAMASPMLLLIPLWVQYRRECRAEKRLADRITQLRAEVASLPCEDAAVVVVAAVLVGEVEAFLAEVSG